MHCAIFLERLLQVSLLWHFGLTRHYLILSLEEGLWELTFSRSGPNCWKFLPSYTKLFSLLNFSKIVLKAEGCFQISVWTKYGTPILPRWTISTAKVRIIYHRHTKVFHASSHSQEGLRQHPRLSAYLWNGCIIPCDFCTLFSNIYEALIWVFSSRATSRARSEIGITPMCLLAIC